jgi:hypothetical protein
MPQPLPFAMRPAEPLPFVVYTPESKLKHPVRLAREMGRDLLASRELAWRLMVRDKCGGDGAALCRPCDV